VLVADGLCRLMDARICSCSSTFLPLWIIVSKRTWTEPDVSVPNGKRPRTDGDSLLWFCQIKLIIWHQTKQIQLNQLTNCNDQVNGKLFYIVRDSGVLDVFNLWSQAQEILSKLKAGLCYVRPPSWNCNRVGAGSQRDVRESITHGFLSIPHVDVVNFQEQ
jgi:hypothetical protein